VTNLDVDILIVGGGLIGGLLMLALESTNINCLLIDRKPLSNKIDADFDARSIALSTASVRILKNLNVWPLIAEHAAVINSIHVSEKGRFGNTKFQSDAFESLGYVVEMQHLNKAMYELLNFDKVLTGAILESFDKNINTATVKTKANKLSIKAKLIVAADGADSNMRNFCDLNCQIKDFQQHALIANIGLARDHKNIAYERFTKSGPLALLPMLNKRASLVWSLSPSEATKLMNMSDLEFLKKLELTFGYRLGKLIKVGQKAIYPLRQVIMPQTFEGSVVFIGNAAHTLHPVAGQGFNLGLRDVATLAQCIVQYGLENDVLKHYQKLRLHDQKAIKLITDGLITLFTKKIPGLGLARGLGLITLDNSSQLKQLFTSYTRGFIGLSPDLVCGIPLDLEEM
jgi:2-octaprenyl-6-methoxyphenol hydroxylase